VGVAILGTTLLVAGLAATRPAAAALDACNGN